MRSVSFVIVTVVFVLFSKKQIKHLMANLGHINHWPEICIFLPKSELKKENYFILNVFPLKEHDFSSAKRLRLLKIVSQKL